MPQFSSSGSASHSSVPAAQGLRSTFLRRGLSARSTQTIATPGVAGSAGPARARLAAIQGQLADARSRGFTDAHPDVIALKSQLAAAQAAARGEPLKAGDVLLAGALGPMVSLQPGNVVRTKVAGIGE